MAAYGNKGPATRLGRKFLKTTANNTKRKAPFARRALGLFVVVWLNIALQPCAMAFSTESEPDCIHCPPAQTHHDVGNNQHAGHDMGSPHASCLGDAAGCSVLDEIQFDARTSDVKLKDLPNEIPLGLAPVDLTLHASLQYASAPTLLLRSFPPGTPPPLNKLYCVYLK